MAEGMTRDQQETDVFYVCPNDQVFVTTDGIGRFWYDTLELAVEEFGTLPVVSLDDMPEDY